MKASQNNQITWLYYQNAPFIAYQTREEAPIEHQSKLHAYVYGEKAGTKKGTIEYRFYVDFDAVFLGCVYDNGQYGDVITYTFKDIDDGRIYKMTVPFDNKGKQLFFRLASIARETKVVSCNFNASVSNGVATFGKYINITGEGGLQSNPLHQGTYYNGVQFEVNPKVIKGIVDAWNSTCDFFFASEGAEEVAKAKSEFFATGVRVKTPFPTKTQQSKFWDAYEALLAQYTQSKLVSKLNDLLSLNIEYNTALAAGNTTAAAITSGDFSTENVPDNIPDNMWEEGKTEFQQEPSIQKPENKAAMNVQAPLVIPVEPIVVPDVTKLDDSDDLPF